MGIFEEQSIISGETKDHICEENLEIVSSGGGDIYPLPCCKICNKIIIRYT